MKMLAGLNIISTVSPYMTLIQLPRLAHQAVRFLHSSLSIASTQKYSIHVLRPKYNIN